MILDVHIQAKIKIMGYHIQQIAVQVLALRYLRTVQLSMALIFLHEFI